MERGEGVVYCIFWVCASLETLQDLMDGVYMDEYIPDSKLGEASSEVQVTSHEAIDNFPVTWVAYLGLCQVGPIVIGVKQIDRKCRSSNSKECSVSQCHNYGSVVLAHLRCSIGVSLKVLQKSNNSWSNTCQIWMPCERWASEQRNSNLCVVTTEWSVSSKGLVITYWSPVPPMWESTSCIDRQIHVCWSV